MGRWVRRQVHRRLRRILCVALGLAGTWTACSGGAAEEPPWNKLQTEAVVFKTETQVSSPGLYDRELQNTVLFPAPDKLVEIPLPHAGLDPAGKPRPALLGRYADKFLWIDLNGNSRNDPGEVKKAEEGEAAGPFAFKAHYEDGSSGEYLFNLFHAGGGRFQILRCCARKGVIGKTPFFLLDDNGNGRYDDLGKDAVLILGEPVSLLGRQIFLEGQFYELLVHPAGETVEFRLLKSLVLGGLNPFLLYSPLQKTENLLIHTLIVKGAEGAFSFDLRLKERQVPIGAYDLVFALLERNKELVVMKGGERTSFVVEKDKIASPQWGGPLESSFKTESDGEKVTVYPPKYLGAGTEEYRPVDYRKVPLRAYKFLVWRDRTLNNVERFESQGYKRFTELPDGQLEPLIFEHYRNDELEIRLQYVSSVLGSVVAKERVQFVFKRR